MNFLRAIAVAMTMPCLAGAQTPAAEPGPAPAVTPTPGATVGRAAAEPTLKVGMPAPDFRVDAWLKGTPVTAFEPGRVYAVEFWSTMCIPCIKSVPHLTRIQKEHAGVTVVGVATHEHQIESIGGREVAEIDRVKEFIQRQGDKMGYTVAYDELKETGGVYRTWFEASGGRGIPHALVVDGAGRIGFVGHPANKGFEEAIAAALKSAPEDKLAARPGAPAVQPAPGAEAPKPAAAKKPAKKPALKPGADAPALAGVTWIKGPPVQEFQKGRVYLILPFGIAPKINIAAIEGAAKLQRANAGLTVVAVGHMVRMGGPDGDFQVATEKSLSEYVEKQGDAMPFAVCADKGHKVMREWVIAAGGGLTSAYLVGQDGKVAWIGPADPAKGEIEPAVEAALPAAAPAAAPAPTGGGAPPQGGSEGAASTLSP